MSLNSRYEADIEGDDDSLNQSFDLQRLHNPSEEVEHNQIEVDGGDREDDGKEGENGEEGIKFSWIKLWRFAGPGFLISISYIDPGNLESDLQAGAYTGYQLGWVLLLSTCVGLFLQILSCRVGVATSKHLAQLCREHYAFKTRIALWLMTELAVIGSDIQEVVGSAIALQILFNLPLWIGVLITGADTFTFLLIHHLGIRKLEAFFAAIIATMIVCFATNFAVVKPSPVGIATGFVPLLSSYALFPAAGLIGSVIMPHSLFLQSALVQSRKIDRTKPNKIKEAFMYYGVETAIALFISFIINELIVCVFAQAFFNPDCAQKGLALIDGSCAAVGLREAGNALRQALGSLGQTMWAIGLLAAGQSSTMTGVFAGQYIMSGFVLWDVPAWKRITVTRAIALVPAILVAVSTTGDAGIADTLDQYLNILQSLQLVFAVLPLLRFTCDPILMGEHANGTWSSLVAYLLVALFLALNSYLFIDFVIDPHSPIPHQIWFYVVLALLSFVYLCFVIHLLFINMRGAGLQRYWCIRKLIKGKQAQITDDDLLYGQSKEEYDSNEDGAY